ncbi:hypothetical protein [Deinococcus kurensis]|uniref:hypothetical protein n=1 Tax=Deinococcus kurensis TaxID=2662757 RepID=UPI0012D2D9C0|nr:hypothetical protein [Deinococcus kurensis]
MAEDFYLPNGYSCSDELNLPDSSYVIMKIGSEDRCNYLIQRAYAITSNVILLHSIDRYSYRLELNGTYYNLKSRGKDDFDDFLGQIPVEDIYIDLTSLEIYELPRLIKGFNGRKRILCIYAEPKNYITTDIESSESDYELYETHSEISALPGYSIVRPDNNYNFVPILGFQGNRLTYMSESLQALEENTYPIVGSPGYKMDFGFICISENRRLFESRNIVRNLTYYPANAPFRIYRMLKKLSLRTKMSIVIGLLGTKPQALGSIIFAIKNPGKCELVYDFPNKRESSFSGIGKIYVYLVSDMWDVIDSVA